MIDKNGRRQEVKVDANGNAFYTDQSGKKTAVPKQGSSQMPEMFLDKNGKPYVLDVKGERRALETDINGQPYYLDSEGLRINLTSQPVANFHPVFKDEYGNSYIVERTSGHQIQVFENEFG